MTLWWRPCSGALETQLISCLGPDGPYYLGKSWASCASVSRLEKSANRSVRIQNWGGSDTAVVWELHRITCKRKISVCTGRDICLPLKQHIPLLLFRLLACLEEGGHCDVAILHFSAIFKVPAPHTCQHKGYLGMCSLISLSANAFI